MYVFLCIRVLVRVGVPLAASHYFADGSGSRFTTNYQPVDAMYEEALAGPLAGPLLRLFLAQYLRCVTCTFGSQWGSGPQLCRCQSQQPLGTGSASML
jgi:hypothetical protein